MSRVQARSEVGLKIHRRGESEATSRQGRAVCNGCPSGKYVAYWDCCVSSLEMWLDNLNLGIQCEDVAVHKFPVLLGILTTCHASCDNNTIMLLPIMMGAAVSYCPIYNEIRPVYFSGRNKLSRVKHGDTMVTRDHVD